MQNFLNSVDSLVADSVRGICSAYPQYLHLNESPLFVRRQQVAKNKVALVSGGGSGHEPLHLGFVGKGMLDAACPGRILTSPTPDQIAAAITSLDADAGVLLLVKNYQGDKMNFTLAQQMADCESRMVIIDDDASFEHRQQARGVAGTLVVEKLVGAAAEQGENLDTLVALAEKTNLATSTIGVTLNPLTLPMASEPMYQLPSTKIEYGVGIHGEKGRERIDALYAKDMVARMVDDVLLGLPRKHSREVLLFVNGLGGSPLMELYVLFDAANQYLENAGYAVARSLVGSYVTSLSMLGASITLAVLDEELKAYWDASVDTPHLRW